MAEQIKQEIINNIYENGEGKITGPVLQDVLIDMVDDYNEKISSGSIPAELIEKTGSWDDASSWVENNSESVALKSDLEGLATTESLNSVSESLSSSIAAITGSDLSGYATTQSVLELSSSLSASISAITGSDITGYLTTASYQTDSASFDNRINSIDVTGYATTESLNSVSESISGSLEEIRSSIPSDYATEADINAASQSVKQWVGEQNYVPGSEFGPFSQSVNHEIADSVNLIAQVSRSVSQSIVEVKDSIPSDYATQNDINAATESVKTWVGDQGYLTEHQDISGLATTQSVNTISSSLSASIAAIEVPDVSGLATTQSVNSLSESVANDFANLDIPDVSGLATTESLNAVSSSLSASIAAITGSSADLSGYLTTASYQTDSASFDSRFEDKVDKSVAYGVNAEVDIADLDFSVDNLIAEITESVTMSMSTDPDEGRTISLTIWNSGNNSASVFIPSSINQSAVICNGVSLSEDYELNIPASEYADVVLSYLADTYYVRTSVDLSNVSVDLSGYATTASLNDLSSSVGTISSSIDTRITNVSNSLSASIADVSGSGGGSNSPWELGTGTESAVLKNTAYPNSASNIYAVAEGAGTVASGPSCHAEGNFTWAGGEACHAEGYQTITGPNTYAAHAEGYYTIASNQFEHAEGMWNSTSSGQRFSVGVGTSETRSNAISVIGSEGLGYVFVKGIGGYDGTNPTTGSNDLASYLRNEIGDVSASLAALR